MHNDHRAAGIAGIDAVFPLSRDRLTFEHHEHEGLTPHKVKTLYLMTFDEPNVYIDISKTFNIKMKALKAHKSQVNEIVLKRLENLAVEAGEKISARYAEGFVRLDLN